MRRNKTRNKTKRYMAILLALITILSGSFVLPGQAKTDAITEAGTLDATSEVVVCDGDNPNQVESLGVKFLTMGQADRKLINGLNLDGQVMISGVMAEEKSAFVLEFQKPIDTSKLEYLTIGIFAGMNTKLRVYNSDAKDFVEDTASDVLTFSTWDVEKKMLVLKKYADADGYVRNITFYVASMQQKRSFIVDYFQFTAVKNATEDFALKSTVNTYYTDQNLRKNQIPTYRLNEEGLLKDLGWDNAIYIDGSEDHNWKPGRYVTLKFDQVNTQYYEKIYVDFWANTDLDFTIYAYDADELNYSKATADQIVKMKGVEKTTLVLDAAKLADKSGYISEINLLLASHSGASQKLGFQAFFGDITFRLPREQARVSIYTEKLSGGYQESDVSTTLEGMAGERAEIAPYTAEELGLYGYQYDKSAKNVLSGVFEEGKILELKLYYSLKSCKVTINNDNDEPVVKTVKYGTKLDLMEYRKENMLMNITLEGLVTQETTVTISGDTVIDITQEPGNYVLFMVDGELYATRTYTSAENAEFSEPLVPVKKGCEGSWEEYTLDGGDKVVNAVYKEAKPAEPTGDDSNIIINVANKMNKVADNSALFLVFMIVGIVLVAAFIVLLILFLVRKGVLKKKYVFAGGISVAACAAIACLLIFVVVPAIRGSEDKKNTVVTDTPNDYTFDALYVSEEQKEIKADETLTYQIDKELGDNNYLQIDVDSDVNLLGTIEYYNIDDQNESNMEEFYLEGGSSGNFYQFLDNYRENGSGQFKKHLTQITLKNVSKESGSVTVNKVAIADRDIDLDKAEVYIENEYLKVGMDLMCGGALTYLEQLPRDGKKLEEVLNADGDIQLGLDYSKKEGAKLLSDSVNLINIYDVGREVQQSYYADVGEAQGYTRGYYVGIDQEWPYNPVQGGDQDGNISQIIDYRIEKNQLYVKTRAMDWGQHNSTTKSYMENWYSLNDDMLVVKNRFVDWNGFADSSSPINNEMPATYFAQAFDTYVTYDGNAPWTNGTLVKKKGLSSWIDGAYETKNPSENWYAWVNDDDYGIGMYIPGIEFLASGRIIPSSAAADKENSNAEESTLLKDYRPARTSEYTQAYVYNTDYTAPVITTTMDSYVPMEYSYVICLGNVDELRSGFQSMDLSGAIDNSGFHVWDD